MVGMAAAKTATAATAPSPGRRLRRCPRVCCKRRLGSCCWYAVLVGLIVEFHYLLYRNVMITTTSVSWSFDYHHHNGNHDKNSDNDNNDNDNNNKNKNDSHKKLPDPVRSTTRWMQWQQQPKRPGRPQRQRQDPNRKHQHQHQHQQQQQQPHKQITSNRINRIRARKKINNDNNSKNNNNHVVAVVSTTTNNKNNNHHRDILGEAKNQNKPSTRSSIRLRELLLNLPPSHATNTSSSSTTTTATTNSTTTITTTTRRRRLELVHIPKTGGTSLELAAAEAGIPWSYCHHHDEFCHDCLPNPPSPQLQPPRMPYAIPKCPQEPYLPHDPSILRPYHPPRLRRFWPHGNHNNPNRTLTRIDYYNQLMYQRATCSPYHMPPCFFVQQQPQPPPAYEAQPSSFQPLHDSTTTNTTNRSRRNSSAGTAPPPPPWPRRPPGTYYHNDNNNDNDHNNKTRTTTALFAIVRHPYDRMVSEFGYKCRKVNLSSLLTPPQIRWALNDWINQTLTTYLEQALHRSNTTSTTTTTTTTNTTNTNFSSSRESHTQDPILPLSSSSSSSSPPPWNQTSIITISPKNHSSPRQPQPPSTSQTKTTHTTTSTTTTTTKPMTCQRDSFPSQYFYMDCHLVPQAHYIYPIVATTTTTTTITTTTTTTAAAAVNATATPQPPTPVILTTTTMTTTTTTTTTTTIHAQIPSWASSTLSSSSSSSSSSSWGGTPARRNTPPDGRLVDHVILYPAMATDVKRLLTVYNLHDTITLRPKPQKPAHPNNSALLLHTSLISRSNRNLIQRVYHDDFAAFGFAAVVKDHDQE